MTLDSIDKSIINRLQGDFPITENPWDDIAQSLQLSVDDILSRIQQLQQQGYISRFGPMYHAEKMGGGLTLAAMKVADEDYEQVSELVNSYDEVAHNYARDHELNMWFVVATETPEAIDQVIKDIEQRSAVRVFNMPKQKEYFLQLRFEV